ncbi:Protein phosphatase 4 core regulatory subunit R2 [Raphanus sativus]|uniref:Uncharacterized protein LOC108845854 n=1 Tax=Raphanus sativus TaxID=3726 RepID=A0A6J0MPZ3_RAPSA|nr:uncharacterized protein LOC108845854 [Raphanus sativus]KAJ4871745.1 Protein phosphatase 4 core regulatory subunit R2 [Raphanus sativus]
MRPGDYSQQAKTTEMPSSSSDREAPNNTSSVDPPPLVDDGIPGQDHVVLAELPEHPPGALQKAEMLSEDEVKGTLEAVASTGKFWQDWEKLKGMLSWWLKKVLSEYPEANMKDEQQKEALGETYPELVRRLDEALLSFDEGPPFTLQRLCEILLAARSIYPKLSKLALALEKNLLVTSMLSISTEPQSQTTEETNAATEDTETAAAKGTRANGIEAVVGSDKDEIMTEVEEEEEADVDDAMTIDMETIDEPSETMKTTKAASESETSSEITAAKPSPDPMAAEEGDPRLP